MSTQSFGVHPSLLLPFLLQPSQNKLFKTIGLGGACERDLSWCDPLLRVHSASFPAAGTSLNTKPETLNLKPCIECILPLSPPQVQVQTLLGVRV